MQTLEIIIGKLLDSFDFGYMLSVNIATYLIIKLIDSLNGAKQVPTAFKRIVAVIIGLSIGIVLHLTSTIDIRILIYSFVLSLVSFDVIFKPFLNFLGDKVNYKKFKN